MSWLPAVLVLGGLIFLHEMGHYLAARACGVRVEEFSLGLGPKLIGVRRGPTLYALRLIPILGYVRLAGMYPQAADDGDAAEAAEEEEVAVGVPRWQGAARPAPRPAPPPAAPDDFAARPLAQRVLIIAAGPLANFCVALMLFATVFGAVGLPTTPTLHIRAVEPRMPAAEAGLRPGDEITAVDGQAVKSWSGLHTAIVAAVKAHPGAPLELTVRRHGVTSRQPIQVMPVGSANGPVIGVMPVMNSTRLPLGRALTTGAAQTGLSVYQSLAALVSLIAHAVRGAPTQAQFMGPIGIGNQIDQANEAGISVLMLMAALLSANLGLLNLLPVPALDGGRLAFLGVEWLRGGRPVDPAKEGMVHFIGLAVLMAFIVLVSMHDIAQLG